MNNQTSVTEFLLMGFSNYRDMQIMYFVMLLFIYLVSLTGNFLLFFTVLLNQRLHTPMYFFLVNLSLSDVFYISVVIPKSMAISLTNNKLISYAGCVAQVFLVLTCASSELTLLTVMAYDRYVAICHPLQYGLIMNWGACIKMVAACWVSNFINAVIHTTATFRLHFCKSNIIEQFFCDVPQLQKISCSDTRINQILILGIGSAGQAFCILFIFTSYGFIFSAVLKMSSDQARSKVFSTCVPHMTVYFLFASTCSFSYMRPKSLSSPTMDLLSAFLYIVLPPLLNPIIYSLRNKDIQEAVRKIVSQSKRNAF